MIKTTALCRVFYALKIPDHLLAYRVTHDFGNFRKPNGPVITTRAAGYVCRPDARTEVGIRWLRMGCHRRLALVQPAEHTRGQAMPASVRLSAVLSFRA